MRAAPCREDVATAAHLPEGSEAQQHLYRELASAAESGWDFSGRWMAQEGRLASTRTTAMLPVDLNTFLFVSEALLAQLIREKGRAEEAKLVRTCNLLPSGCLCPSLVSSCCSVVTYLAAFGRLGVVYLMLLRLLFL